MKTCIPLLSVLVLILMLQAGHIIASEPMVNIDNKGIAMDGYDPVSYHQGEPRKGSEDFVFEYNGARYLFTNAGNLATFTADPATYEPAYGGWCAWAMLDGEKVKVDPETFKIVDGKTLLYYHTFFVDTLKEWNTLAEKEGEAALLDQADEQWESLAAGNP
jgi:YHS domain-containing protein